MEDLEANVSNISTSTYSSNAAAGTDLNAGCSINNPLAKFQKHLKKWCQNLKSTKGGLKEMQSTDVRRLYVRTLTKVTKSGKNRKMKIITFQICSKGTSCSGGAKKIYRKIINE